MTFFVFYVIVSEDITAPFHQVYFTGCITALFFAFVSWTQQLIPCVAFTISDFCSYIALLEYIQLMTSLATLHRLWDAPPICPFWFSLLFTCISRKYFHIPNNWHIFSSISHLLLPLTRTINRNEIVAKGKPELAVKFITCPAKTLSTHLGATQAITLP